MKTKDFSSDDAILAEALARLHREALDQGDVERFELTLEAAPTLACVRDMKGKILRLNRAWSDLLGFSREELLGVSLLDLVHPDDIWATHDRMQAVSAGVHSVGFTNRYRRRDGGYLQLRWASRLTDDRVYGVARPAPPPSIVPLRRPKRALIAA